MQTLPGGYALRYNDWKVTFKYLDGNFFDGQSVAPNMPFVVNLRQDPFERFPTESKMYMEWMTGLALSLAPALPVSLLLGTSLDTPGGLVVTRVAAFRYARDHQERRRGNSSL